MGFVPENRDPADRSPDADEDPHPKSTGRLGAKAPRDSPENSDHNSDRDSDQDLDRDSDQDSDQDTDYDSDAVTDADFEPELTGGEPRIPAIFRDPDTDPAGFEEADKNNGSDNDADEQDVDSDVETGRRFVPPTFGPSRRRPAAEVTHSTGPSSPDRNPSPLETPQPTGQDRVTNDSGVQKYMATVAVARPGIRSGEPTSTPRPAFVSDWSKLTDAEIMLRVRDGDDAGYEYLLTKYRKPILHFMFRMVHNQAIAEELAQEVFLRVYRSRATYRAEARFTTWMYRIATNLGVNYARDTKHERAASNVYLDEPDYDTGTTPDLADSTPLVEADLVREERMKAIRAHVMALPERQRTAVFMHKYQGLDYKQIGQVLKLSESATKSLLFRAYQTLRDRLKDFV